MPGWAEADIFTGETNRDPPSKLGQGLTQHFFTFFLFNSSYICPYRLGVGSAPPGVLIVALAFLLPSKWDKNKTSPALLDWRTGNQ